MAVVLCIGLNRDLIATRKLMLEAAGHTVVTSSNEVEVEKAAATHQFDVVVVGQRIPPPEKRRILQLARKLTPEAKVLELYEHSENKVLVDADDWLLVPTDIPAHLVERVEALATRKRPRPPSAPEPGRKSERKR